MIFSKYIKNNPFYNKIAIALISRMLLIFRVFKLFRKKSTDSIVIIALHKLGDSVFTIKAIKNIHHHHKKDIYLLCFTDTVPIFNIVFNTLNIIALEHGDFFFTNRIAKSSVRKVLKRLNPSIVYDLTGTITSASLLFTCSAKEIIGLNEPYYHTLYTKYTPIRTTPHITDMYIDAIRSVIPVSLSNLIETSNNSTGDYILIHPFAGTKPKEWGLMKFLSLIEYLNEKYECRIVVQPDNISTDVLREVERKNIRFIETKTTTELIEVIKRCLLLIGNDSGPLHIANLLGKPTFTIYGPTNPDYHKPLEGINQYIFKKIPCSPKQNKKLCFTHGGVLGCPSYECMRNLTLDEVRKSVDDFIELVREKNILVSN